MVGTVLDPLEPLEPLECDSLESLDDFSVLKLAFDRRFRSLKKGIFTIEQRLSRHQRGVSDQPQVHR